MTKRVAKFSPSWLVACRKRQNIKQGALANYLGVSQVMISYWERGHLIPSEEFHSRMIGFFQKEYSAPEDKLIKRLVENSERPTHIVCDFSHVLLAASRARQLEWKCYYIDLLGKVLFKDLPDDIVVAEDKYSWLDYEQRINETFLVSTCGRSEGDYKIRPTEMLWEPFSLSDGKIVRLVTNVSADAVPERAIRL